MARIVFVLPDLPLSGAATRTVHLAECLVSAGYSVVVVTFLRIVDKSLQERLRKSGVEVLRLTFSRDLRRTLCWMVGKPVTIIHAAMPTAGLLGILLSRIFRRRIVYSYTNCLHAQRPLRPRSFMEYVKSWIEGVLARKCDALHAVSDCVADQLLRAYPLSADRVHAIPYRITPPATHGSGSQLDRFDDVGDATPRLLYVGRLIPPKRADDVIRAVAAVRQTQPKVRLVVLGSGPERNRLLSLVADLGVTDNVVFIGETSNPARFFNWADMLLHPSLYEGYPRVFAEAVDKRVPIVSIDSPYARELAESNSRIFLARPMDSDSFANKIVEAHQYVGPEKVADGENTDTCARAFCDLYLSLATNGT